MQIYRLRINHNLCTGCNVCVVSCPINFNKLKKEGKLTDKNAVILVKNGIAISVYEDERKVNCDGCGVCIEACPQDAIELEIIEVE
ncbi:MAG: 4Fe-4S dicluster domain-containing protein [Candidatus Lokiarchaeota archaeon]|nr:4Fe-4S dicluster domain-containing protein [Candidatus Lokiarchaeota archaeon]